MITAEPASRGGGAGGPAPLLQQVNGYVDIALPTPKFVKARLSNKSMEVALPWPLDGAALYTVLRSYILPYAFGCSFKGHGPDGPAPPCQIHDVKIEASEDPCHGRRVEGSLEFDHAQDILPLRFSRENSADAFLEPMENLQGVAKDTKRPQWEQVFRDIRFDGKKQSSTKGRWSVANFKILQISIAWCSPAHALNGRPVSEGGHTFDFSLAAYQDKSNTNALSTNAVTGQMVSAYVQALLDRIGDVAGAAVREKEWAEQNSAGALAAAPAWLRGPVAGLGARAWRFTRIKKADEAQIGNMALTALIRTLNQRFAFKTHTHASQLTFHCLEDLLPTDRRSEEKREAALNDFLKGLKKGFFTALAEELKEEKNGYASTIQGMADEIPDGPYCDPNQAVEVVVRQRTVGAQTLVPTVLLYKPQSRPPPDSASSWWGWQRLHGAGAALLQAHNNLMRNMWVRS